MGLMSPCAVRRSMEMLSSPAPSSSASSFGGPQSQAEILSSLERLGQLFAQGMLTESEFKTKKADLLARL